MLIVVLFVSFVNLFWMNLLAYSRQDGVLLRKTDGVSATIAAIAPVAFASCVCGSFFLLLQMVGLVLAFHGTLRYAPDRPWIFTLFSPLMVAGAFIGTSIGVSWGLSETRQQYAVESFADRMAPPKKGKPLEQVGKHQRWVELESRLQEDEWEAKRRSAQLQRLHEETTFNFVNSPGFGVTRMTPLATFSNIDYGMDDTPPVATTHYAAPQNFYTEQMEEPYVGEYGSLLGLHFAGVRDFVNVKGFGYVKDSNHVAGFRPHQFSKAPPVEKYRIKRLELVSLLMHHGAVVYVSKELPRMKDLKKAATRSLSDFEIAGLTALQRGDDLFVREFGGTLHVVGAIRSVSQCVQCHDGDRGDLLGAFSYSLEHATRP